MNSNILERPHAEMFEAIEAEVLRLADEDPDAVYHKPVDSITCQYLAGEAGSGEGCIFGQALLNLGVRPEILQAPRGIKSLMIEEVFLKDLDNETFGEYDQALNAWSEVQACQDRGMVWAQAVYPIRYFRKTR